MESDPHLERLRTLVEREAYCLTDEVYGAVQQFFEGCIHSPGYTEELNHRTPEYTRSEYLSNANSDGKIIASSPKMITGYRDMCRQEAAFTHWFREEPGAVPHVFRF